jgi:hypothetical protein
MEGEIVIKRWEDLDGEVSSYRLCCILSTLPPSTHDVTNVVELCYTGTRDSNYISMGYQELISGLHE